MTRTCSLKGPAKPVTLTVTRGLLIYFPNDSSNSRASTVGVFPVTSMSSTSEVVTLPSGRTIKEPDISGLRHTKIDSVSPAPIKYL